MQKVEGLIMEIPKCSICGKDMYYYGSDIEHTIYFKCKEHPDRYEVRHI